MRVSAGSSVVVAKQTAETFTAFDDGGRVADFAADAV